MKSTIISIPVLALLIAFFAFIPVDANAACAYAHSPLSYGFSASGGTSEIAVTPSGSSCVWTATSSKSWITITGGNNGVGNGTVSYMVAANTTGIPRRGTITIGGETFTVRQGKGSFADVPEDVYKPYIYSIFMENITTGYGGTDTYNPTAGVTRGQMAAFIIRARHGENFDYTETPYFSDVPATNGFFKYVQKLKDMGITAVTGSYNVDGMVTRGQMAAFIIRSIYGETFTYTLTPYFSDVPSDHMFFPYVQKMKDMGITAVTGIYDVDGVVTRAQMAAFLTRAYLEGENGFYTGATNKALINNTNAEQLLLAAYSGRNIGSSIPIISLLTAEKTAQNHVGSYPLAIELSRIMQETIQKANLTPKTGSRGAIYSYTDTIDGPCGGDVTFTISVDTQGSIGGTGIFNSYCTGGTYLSGNVSFSVDTSGAFTFEYTNVAFASGGVNFTLNGTISNHVTGSQYSIAMDMQVRYDNTGEVDWLRDFSMTITLGSGSMTFSWNATYYSPDYGYIAATTPVPFVINSGDIYPSAGVLVVTGDSDSSDDDVAARLTILSSTTYRVEVDDDGDGTYEWDSGVLTW